jgi:hypothetical protein
VVGDEDGEEDDDFVIDLKLSWVDEIQRDEEQLVVALAWRGEAGAVGEPGFCRRAKPSPFSSVKKGKGRECGRCRCVCVCGDDSSTSREGVMKEASRSRVSDD